MVGGDIQRVEVEAVVDEHRRLIAEAVGQVVADRLTVDQVHLVVGHQGPTLEVVNRIDWVQREAQSGLERHRDQRCSEADQRSPAEQS